MQECLDEFPLIAILRGLIPEHAVDVCLALEDAGIRIMEVPLNSPQALVSIDKLSTKLPSHCMIGAGTVLTTNQVVACHGAGAKIIISPNTDSAVIRQTVNLDLCSMPGFATATEALKAIANGAKYLKLFPADTYGFSHIKAIKAILPSDIRVVAVGGVDASNLKDWSHAGSDGVGLGSSLFKPTMSLTQISKIAKELVMVRQQILAYN